MFAKTLLTISALVLIFAVININAGKNNKSNKKDNGQEGSLRGPPPSGVIALMSLCSQYIFFKFFSHK
jgi:hypothetical protein